MIEVEDRTQPEPETQPLCAPTSLEDALQITQPVIERAQRMIEELAAQGKDDDFMPAVFFFSEERGVDILGVVLGDSNEEKDAVAATLRMAAASLADCGLWGILFVADGR